MNYYVWRIDCDEIPLIKNELSKGNLRQGWGATGMDIRNSFDDFKAGWTRNWGAPDDKFSLRKYRCLRNMLNMKKDDIIIVPKYALSENVPGKYFTIFKCSKTYDFNVIMDKNDYGHFIGVDYVGSWPYEMNYDTRLISGKFVRPYASPINNCYSESFCQSIDNLLSDSPPTTLSQINELVLDVIIEKSEKKKQEYLKLIVDSIRELNPYDFEKIIEEIFTKNGFELIGRNISNGIGGDIDLMFDSAPVNSLMDEIYKISHDDSNDDAIPKICIQAKKKTGIDDLDKQGIDQLITQSDSPNNILILISLADDFTPDAKQYAREKGVILINGIQMSAIIEQFGIKA